MIGYCRPQWVMNTQDVVLRAHVPIVVSFYTGNTWFWLVCVPKVHVSIIDWGPLGVHLGSCPSE